MILYSNGPKTLQQTWIYNQGVIAAGLGALYAATGDATLLDQAEITLDAAIRLKTQNNILRESCDDATSSTCNADQVSTTYTTHRAVVPTDFRCI